MNAKIANLAICRQFNKWLDSIEDKSIRELVEQNTIVTGGCIASMLLKEDVNDFDVYFRTKEAALKIVTYYVEQFKANPPTRFKAHHGEVRITVEELPERIRIKVKSAGVAGVAGEEGADNYQYFEMLPAGTSEMAQQEYLQQAMQNTTDLDETPVEVLDQELTDKEDDKEGKKRKKFRPVFLTSNAITLSDKLQIVARFFGEPDQIHENYDFVHCTNYWISWEKKLVLRQEALESLLAKQLRYVGSKYPICSVIRTRKFLRRGWTINAGQYLKMCFQISQLDLNRIDVLEEQLVGVDAAYFSHLIEMLRKRDPDNTDSNYLMTVIDRIF
jgi:hypothetical protein